MSEPLPNPTPELEKGAKYVVPTSFRFTPEVLKAIDEGAQIFRMNRTKWVEFLVTAAVTCKKVSISTERAKIEIELVPLNTKRRRVIPTNLYPTV